MWIIKYALAAAILLAVMYFSFQNAQEIATVKLGDYLFENVRLIMVIYASFAMGVVFWFFVSVFQYFKAAGQVSDYRRKNKQLLEEIKALRNLPLDEVAPQDLADQPEENS